MGNRIRTLLDVFWTTDRHTCIRLQQWSLTLVIYVVGGLFMLALSRHGVMDARHVLGWMTYNLSGLALLYAAIRSGFSQRFSDPSLTQAQMLFGVTNVVACYAISMQARGAMLYPLMLIFTFGAFSLDWRRITVLTIFSLATVGASMWLLHQLMPDRLDPLIDWSNFLIASIMLPGTSMVAANLGALRMKLRTQRAQLEDALARIQELALRDTLTGLYNRRHAEQALRTEFKRVARGKQPLSVALLDLDHFKSINDRYGHGAGDEVLKAFAMLLQSQVRTIDIPARWGGEEFLLMMPNTSGTEALVVLERLRTAVARCPITMPKALISFTLSAGVGQLRPKETATSLLSRIDAALYRAKSAGRNCIVLAEAAKAVRSRECTDSDTKSD